jgi:glucokinase
MSSKVALIADLGGTNARFQLLRVDDQSPFSHIVLHSATYPTASSKNFPELVARFVAEAPEAPDVCACAVCGPIIDGAAYCASAVLAAPWQFDEAQVSEACGGCASVLLNGGWFKMNGFSLPPAACLQH